MQLFKIHFLTNFSTHQDLFGLFFLYAYYCTGIEGIYKTKEQHIASKLFNFQEISPYLLVVRKTENPLPPKDSISTKILPWKLAPERTFSNFTLTGIKKMLLVSSQKNFTSAFLQRFSSNFIRTSAELRNFHQRRGKTFKKWNKYITAS